MSFRFAALIIFLVTACTAKGQQKPWPLKISLFNESTSMPFTRLFPTPVHPGVEVGTERTWKESSRFRFNPSVSLGYLFHGHLYQAIYLSGALGIDYKLKFGLNLKTGLGVGYMHTFTVQQEYQFDKGSYKKGRDHGNARVIPSLSLGIGYRLKPKVSPSPEFFVLYQTWVEYPYSPGFIPLMAHTNMMIGYTFFPFN